MRYFIVMIAALFVAAPAAAQDRGFYAGASLGQAKAKDFCEGLGGPGTSCDDKDNAWKIFGGYQINRNFAAELGYTDLGEATFAVGGLTESVEASAFELVGVGMLPVVDRLSVYGKLGLYRAESDASSNFGFSASESNTDVTFGFGVRYDFGANFAVRAEWQRYADVGGGDVGESDVDVITVGLLVRF